MARTDRPELPWALWAGVAGAIAAAAVSVHGIFSSASSTAAIGFIFVPFIAIAAGVIAGVWGLALGTVVAHLRGLRQVLRPVLIVAFVAAAALPAAIGWETWHGLALARAVHETRAMDRARLEAAFDASPWKRNKFFLGALAQHPAADAALLDRIAQLPDPELHEAMGSMWDVMGDNRKGLAVMRLVAAHPQASPATLRRLAGSANEYVISDVMRNPNTPADAMRPHLNSTHYLVEWGLAQNPNTPVAVLERLSRSDDRYSRMKVANNRAAPDAVLERLTRDSDAGVAQAASRALQRRREPQGRAG